MYYSLGELLDVTCIIFFRIFTTILRKLPVNYFFLYFISDFNIKSQDLVNGIFTLFSESFYSELYFIKCLQKYMTLVI